MPPTAHVLRKPPGVPTYVISPLLFGMWPAAGRLPRPER